MIALQNAAEGRTLRRMPVVFEEMRESYRLYNELNDYVRSQKTQLGDKTVVIDDKIKGTIEKQLSFGQVQTVPKVLMEQYKLEMGAKKESLHRPQVRG